MNYYVLEDIINKFGFNSYNIEQLNLSCVRETSNIKIIFNVNHDFSFFIYSSYEQLDAYEIYIPMNINYLIPFVRFIYNKELRRYKLKCIL